MGGTTKTYQVVQSLARGGMGEVLLAREQAGDVYERHVVLKVVLPHLAQDASFVAAFLDEARLASRLAHPNIVQILDIAQVEERPCLVMEWLRGCDLARLQTELGRLGRAMEPEVLVAILLGAAAGLGHAHRATDLSGRALGIVHRDVSPQNIVVTIDGVVKLVDFGIALSRDRATHTAEGTLKGKIAYMAPEALRGRPVDARADLWALGVVAWQCLTGKRLFDPRRNVDLIGAVLETEIASPSIRRPDLDPELEAIVMGLLRRDPIQRTASAEQLEQELVAWAGKRSLPTASELGAWVRDLRPDDRETPAVAAGRTAVVEPLSVVTSPTGRVGHTATIGTPAVASPAHPAAPMPLDEPLEDVALHETSPSEAPTAMVDDRAAPDRRRLAAWLAFAALLAAVALGVTGVVLGRGEPSPEVSIPVPPAAAPAPEEVPPAARPPAPPLPLPPPALATVRLTVEGLPEGATLWVDGQAQAGATAVVTRGDVTHRVEVRAEDGARLLERDVSARRDLTILLPPGDVRGRGGTTASRPASGPREPSGGGVGRGIRTAYPE